MHARALISEFVTLPPGRCLAEPVMKLIFEGDSPRTNGAIDSVTFLPAKLYDKKKMFKIKQHYFNIRYNNGKYLVSKHAFH